MSAPARLAELQDWLLRAIAAPEPSGAAAETHILPSRSQSAAERLAVYQHAYSARLIDCLCEMFPVLVATLGRGDFEQFAAGYVQQHPPASYTLNHLADHFVEYLRVTRPADVPSPGWPDFLIELARLEHTIDQVFDGPGLEELPPLDVYLLGTLVPEELLQLRFIPAPCLRLLNLQFPINDYYTLARRGESPQWPEPQATYLAITRRDYVVRRVPLEAAEFGVLTSLAAGTTLKEAIAAGGEVSVTQIAEWFAAWGRLRLLSGVDRTTFDPK